MNYHTQLSLFYLSYNLDIVLVSCQQASIIKEEEASTEKMPPED